MEEDNFLIKKYLEGDQSSLKIIIDRYTPSIFNFSKRFVSEAAADITQEVFIKVWKNLKSFNSDKSSFKTWLFVIARNTITDYLRKKRPIPMSHISEGDYLAENIPDVAPLPYVVLEKLQDKEVLLKAMESLPDNYKTVLTLYYGEDMTFKEIGEVLDKPLNTVKSYHYRAIILLKTAFVK